LFYYWIVGLDLPLLSVFLFSCQGPGTVYMAGREGRNLDGWIDRWYIPVHLEKRWLFFFGGLCFGYELGNREDGYFVDSLARGNNVRRQDYLLGCLFAYGHRDLS
jgi:hypothetical protein